MTDAKFFIAPPQTKAEYIQMLDVAIKLADELNHQLDEASKFLEAVTERKAA